ncbi:hypothetical protein GCM10023350_48580 [Nocardioides endophyticus]|uniref:Uncharacterized protein n=1 Tax=Nocardioides endophyticus TaxID=1353775 RepID=A0ABP8ZIN1_9ACTN
MTSPASEAAATPRRAILWATQPTAVLSSLGAAFDDLVVGSLDDAQADLLEATADTALVLAGPIPEPALSAVTNHVVTHPGSRLARSVGDGSGSVQAEQLQGLRILGDACLGDLPVTWWAASDAAADLGPLTGEGPGGLTRSGDDDGFVAHARLLRAQRELAGSTSDRPGRSSVPDLTPYPPRPSTVTKPRPSGRGRNQAPRPPAPPTSRSRSILLGYRLPLAGVLVVLGAALGVLAAEVIDGGEVVWAMLALALATVALALAWVVRTLRILSAEVRTLGGRTRRLRGDVDRVRARLAKRVAADADQGARTAARIRQIESRIAVVSSTSPPAERPLARADRGDADDQRR